MFQHDQKTWVLLLNGASALARAPLPQVPYSPIYVFFKCQLASQNISLHISCSLREDYNLGETEDERSVLITCPSWPRFPDKAT